MGRRDFLGKLGGAGATLPRIGLLALTAALSILLASPVAMAQEAAKTHRIGILTADLNLPHEVAFIEGLHSLGYIEGRNITVLRRSAEGQSDRLPQLAADLVNEKVDVIVCAGAVAPAAIKATRTIPIVVPVAEDFVARGWAKSLRQPGGNVTGLSTLARGLIGKQFELLKEVVPSLSRVGIVHLPRHPGLDEIISEAREATQLLGLELMTTAVREAADLPIATQRMKSEGVNGVVVLRSGFMVGLRAQMAALARDAGLPTMFGHVVEAEAGGLLAYGADTKALFGGAAIYVDKILRGESPGELPITQAQKFYLTVNLKTAKALGIAIPPSILVRANRVIE
jgi:putative ABC transport system substrate-binding protein